MKSLKLGQKGIVNIFPLLFIVASLGVVLFVTFSQTVPSKNKMLGKIYPKPPANAASGAAEDRIIVKFKPAVTNETKEEVYQEVDATVKDKIENLNIDVLTVEPGTVSETVEKLDQDPTVEFVEPDYKAYAAFVPNDEFYPQQWGLTKANFPGAWDVTRGSSIVTIAVVDTGIDGTHPDLAAKIVSRANFTTDADSDVHGHGTHVAGIAAAITNNSVGVSGAGFDTRLLSVKVLDNTGSGSYSWIAQGITWAADNGAKVINLSLTGASPSQTLQDAVNYAWGRGAVVVAAAGNENASTPIFPGSLLNVLAVGATDESDNKASFSNFGSWVDVAAPGVNIGSTYPGNRYVLMDGTSMATPFVSGLAALIIAKNITLSNQGVVNNILNGADKIAGTGTNWTAGRINACKSLECSGPLPTTTPQPTTPPNFGLTFSPSSVNVSIAQNSVSQAITINSTTSNSFALIGYPTSFGPGINWNPVSGGMVIGSSRSILISVINTVPVGTYSGTGVLQDSQSIQRTFPVSVTVTPAQTPAPTPTPIPTPTPRALTAPVVNTSGLTCVPAAGYTGSGITLSWTLPSGASPVTFADISSSSNFSTFYHKAVSGTSTTAPNGFILSTGSTFLTILPATPYFARVWNGVVNSPSSPVFSFPACATPTPTPAPTPACPLGLLGDTDCNGSIDIHDFNAVVTDFNKTGPNILGDVDNDLDVDIHDFNAVVSNFGMTT